MELIAKARAFIGLKCSGENICACCGRKCADNMLLKKTLKSTFTDINHFVIAPSLYVCSSCYDIYNKREMRTKCIFSDTQGTYELLDRKDVINKICNPCDNWFLSVPYSMKKHHWLYAGLSNKHYAYIGTDDRTIVVNYDEYDIERIVNHIQILISYGIPRTEIISGNYSVFTLSKFPVVTKYENVISPVRHSGIVELIVKFTLAVKEKLIYEREDDNPMLSTAERNAINFLSSIAFNSQYRAENGIQFWSGFFERRVNRFKKYDVMKFASKLSESIGTQEGVYLNILTDSSNEELEEMMNTIREKTHIIISMVYGERKKDR